MEQENNNKPKPSFFHRLVAPLPSKDFWIPRNFIDVIFILICFALAWYAMTYDIPQAKVPVICATYWNKWAAERSAYLGTGTIFNATEVITRELNLTIG